jgi:hypothetical protein
MFSNLRIALIFFLAPLAALADPVAPRIEFTQEFFSYCKCGDVQGGAPQACTNIQLTVINRNGQKIIEDEALAKICFWGGHAISESIRNNVVNLCLTQITSLPSCNPKNSMR